MTNLEKRFHADMLNIYENAKRECSYNATRFLSMVYERGGVGAARQLLAAPIISDGFVRLWELGRADLTVEALVLRPEYEPLFTDEERSIAKRRLGQ